MAVINHRIKLSQDSLIGFVGDSVKNIIEISLVINNSWFFFSSFQIEGKKGTSWSTFNGVLLKFMIAETDLRVFIKKCNFASDNLHKTDLISNLSDSESKIGFLWDVPYEGIASVFGAEYDLYL